MDGTPVGVSDLPVVCGYSGAGFSLTDRQRDRARVPSALHTLCSLTMASALAKGCLSYRLSLNNQMITTRILGGRSRTPFDMSLKIALLRTTATVPPTIYTTPQLVRKLSSIAEEIIGQYGRRHSIE